MGFPFFYTFNLDNPSLPTSEVYKPSLQILQKLLSAHKAEMILKRIARNLPLKVSVYAMV